MSIPDILVILVGATLITNMMRGIVFKMNFKVVVATMVEHAVLVTVVVIAVEIMKNLQRIGG